MEDRELLEIAVTALDAKKAKDIKVIKIGDLSMLANYFVIATGTNSSQVKTLADEVDAKISEKGVEPKRIEGRNGANWIVLDYADVVIHVFYEETRDFYDLERLWEDGESVPYTEFLK